MASRQRGWRATASRADPYSSKRDGWKDGWLVARAMAQLTTTRLAIASPVFAALSGGSLYLDLFLRLLRRLRQRHSEHPVLERRFDLVCLDFFRDGHAALE